MSQRNQQRWGGRIALCVALITLLGLPAAAGSKERTSGNKQDGGISPSTIAVLETDLDSASKSLEGGLMVSPQIPVYEPVSPEEQLRATEAHAVATGRNVVVAVLDGGFNLRHRDIAANVWSFGYDAVDRDDDAHDTGNGVDDDRDGIVDGGVGHGTFVAGMVLKAAPGAWILPIRVRDDEGYGSNDELIRGIEFAVKMGADVINLSLSSSSAKSKGLSSALDVARQAGCVIVVAAGNDGLDYLPKMACGEDTISVGAVDALDRLAPFSNWDRYNDSNYGFVLAPGVDLFGPIGASFDDAMGFWSGTSFSAGFVSGAAALLLELDPGMDPAQVCDVIVEECVDPVWHADGTPMRYWGRINLAKLVRYAEGSATPDGCAEGD